MQPVHLFAIALGLAPLCMANQQVVTGRMIYLLNFENYGFAQMAAVALLIAVCSRPAIWQRITFQASHHALGCWIGTGITVIFAAAICGEIFRSQRLSYDDWIETNRLARSYALTLQSAGARHDRIVCYDFNVTDILPLEMGYQPDFLLSSEMTFTHPISRLMNAQDPPADGAESENKLFAYLAATGATPKSLAERLDAVSNADNPNWRDRFMLGGFLFSYSDYWAPLTNFRDPKLDWVAKQEPSVVRRYEKFLAIGSGESRRFVIILPVDKPGPPYMPDQQATELVTNQGMEGFKLKAFRVNGMSRQ